MKSPLAQVVEYKHEVMKALKTSQELIGMIANIRDIDMDSDDAYDVIDHNFFDYSFCDNTFQTDRAVVFVEVVMQRRPSVQFKGMKVMVQVICNKGYAALDTKVFPGVLGNRRDNLALIIADLLEGSDEFGIGELLMTQYEPITTPNGFTGIGLTFDAVDFMESSVYDD